MVDEVRKGLLLFRARYECEYCKRLLRDIEFQIEHVWPESRGGTSEDGNLAISCQRCNKNKIDHVEWIDPFTGGSFPLFNPRTMDWRSHFRRSRDEIIGVSEIGCATAALLFRSTPQYLPPDLQWDKIEGVYENQPLYYFLNHLRYRRLRNDFKILYRQLAAPLPTVDATPEEKGLAYFARDLLLLELYFTRSTIGDVSKGIAYGEHLLQSERLAPHQRAEVLSILSILYQQRATIHFQGGRSGEAKIDQERAYKLFAAARPEKGEELPRDPDPHDLGRFLRIHTVRWKYAHVEVGRSSLSACFERIKDLDPFYATSHNSYLVDLVLLSPEPPKTLLEPLYEGITATLQTEGYGTTTDQAKLITLRRRWWVLHFLLEITPDCAALVTDMGFWKRVSMFNEIRELDSYIKRVSISSKARPDIQHIIAKSGEGG